MKTETNSKESKAFLLTISVIFPVLLLVSPIGSAQTNEDPIGAGSILRSGVDARALAMGGAYVAVADNYSASYWNPAGVTRTEPAYLGGMNYDKFGLGLNVNHLSGGISPSRWPATQNPSGGFSLPYIQDLSFAGTIVGFSTNVRATTPGGDRVAEITYSERTYMGTTGFWTPAIGSIGGSLKYYMFKAPGAGVNGTTAWANGMGFDLGMLAEPLSDFYVGAAGFDVTGTEIKWHNTPSEPTNIAPSRYSGGVAYDLDLSPFPLPEIIAGNTVFAGQYTTGQQVGNVSVDEDWGYKISAGLEYRKSIFALRAGVSKPSNGELGLSAGAGLKVNLLSADFAWVQSRGGIAEGENTSDTVVFSTEFTF